MTPNKMPDITFNKKSSLGVPKVTIIERNLLSSKFDNNDFSQARPAQRIAVQSSQFTFDQIGQDVNRFKNVAEYEGLDGKLRSQSNFHSSMADATTLSAAKNSIGIFEGSQPQKA